jgi:hypothetical protein
MRIILLVVAAILSGTATEANAAGKPPTKFTKCPSPSSPSNSGGYHFSEDCTTLWILPPALATVSLTGIAPSRSKSFCSTVDNLIGVVDTSAKAIRNAAEKQTQGATGNSNAAECTRNRSNLALARAIYASLTAELTTLDQEINKLESQVAACTSTCGMLKLELQTRKSARASRQQKISKINIIVPVLEQLISSCSTADANSPILPDVSKLQDEAKKTGDLILDMYTKFGTIEGATASVLFEVRWQKLVDDFKASNPNLAVERMPVDMALSFVSSRPEGAALPAVFAVNVPGLSSDLKSSDLKNLISNTADVQFGNSASGQIIFSALGACAAGIYSGQAIDASTVYPHLVANVTFRYFVQSERKYRVKYNLVEIYQRIKKVSSSNGLFRSSYESSITNMSSSDEVITVEIESEDPRNAFPDTLDFITDIKRGVLDRAIAQVAKAYLPRDTAAALPAIAPGTPGAPKIAETLRKCANLYCQAGAVVLDLGSALFGGADAASHYLEQNHISAEERVSDKRMVPIFSTFSFKP